MVCFNITPTCTLVNNYKLFVLKLLMCYTCSSVADLESRSGFVKIIVREAKEILVH